jgi:ribonuclease J
LARLESCFVAAKESGRQMVVAGRSLKKIERIARLSGYFSKMPAFLDDKKANSMDPNKILIVCTGSQGEQNSALSKISNDTHKSVKLQDDDIVIFSSRIIPGNESAVMDIQNSLIKKNVKIITDFDCEVHASGHPSKEELEHIYNLAQPKSVIPVHGESVQLYKHAEIAREYGIKNVLIPQDGSVIKLSDNPKIIDRMATSVLGVDGHKLIPIKGLVYRQRKMLSENGVISAVVKCSHGSVTLVNMVSFGIFEESEQLEIGDIKSDVASEIKLSLENISRGKINAKDAQSAVEKIIRSMFLDVRGKKPIVFVHVIE